MEIASGICADQLFQKIAKQKAILAKRGNLNLDLKLDLHDYKTKKIYSGFDVASSFFFVLMYTRA